MGGVTKVEKSRREIAQLIIQFWLDEARNGVAMATVLLKQDEEMLTVAIDRALRNRDERAAKICEGLVTFSTQHEQYMPDDGSPCGWCDGLETAARAIREQADTGG